MAIPFSGDVTSTDVNAANQLVLNFLRKRRGESLWFRKILVWGWNLSLLAVAYLIMLPAFMAEQGLLILRNCTFAIGYFIVAHFLLKWTQFHSAILLYKLRGSVDEHGIECLIDDVQVMAPWTNWVGYSETSNIIVLVARHDVLQEFWRKHFESDADWQALRTLVNQQLPELPR